jgi:hypothetical protein
MTSFKPGDIIRSRIDSNRDVLREIVDVRPSSDPELYWWVLQQPNKRD